MNLLNTHTCNHCTCACTACICSSGNRCNHCQSKSAGFFIPFIPPIGEDQWWDHDSRGLGLLFPPRQDPPLRVNYSSMDVYAPPVPSGGPDLLFSPECHGVAGFESGERLREPHLSASCWGEQGHICFTAKLGFALYGSFKRWYFQHICTHRPSSTCLQCGITLVTHIPCCVPVNMHQW